MTVFSADDPTVALPAPYTLPHSYHPDRVVILPERTLTRQMLAATILGNEMKSIGPESRELVCHLLDDRGDSTDHRDEMRDYPVEQQKETDLSTQRAEDWLRNWDETADSLSASSDPQWD